MKNNTAAVEKKMKNNTAAVEREIRGRAKALAASSFATVFFVGLVLIVTWDKMSTPWAFLILVGVNAILLIIGLLAMRYPLKFKWFFRNLKSEKKAQPKQKTKKTGYRHDKNYGFISKVFDRPVSVSAAGVPGAYVEKCIGFFQNMSEAQIDRLADDAMSYYQEIREYSGDEVADMPETLSGREILDWVYPKVMWIEHDDGAEGKIQFIVECDCAWETEHGMEIIVFDKEIIHVGSYDGDLQGWREEYPSDKEN